MSIPKSLLALGLKTPDQVRKRRRLMIGTEGLTNSGKTEFLLSIPGPKVLVPIDRSYDGVLDSANPPKSRIFNDLLVDEGINLPNIAGGVPSLTSPGGGFKQEDFMAYFKQVRERIYSIIAVPELNACLIDGDSDLWELQVLAEFGRLTQIHPLQYPALDAVRKTMTNRWWQSGKIIVGTNKLKDKYVDVIDDATGLPKKDASGKNEQVKVPGEYKRQGYRDQNYLWQMQIRHLYEPPVAKTIQAGPLKGKVTGKTPPRWGLRILKFKPNPMLEGDELWGDKCNFLGLIQHCYPHVDPVEFGFGA